MRLTTRCSLLVLACLTLSCASANELARRSEHAEHAGDYDRAYREARSALDKDPGNARARAALSAAAYHLYGQYVQRIRSLAAVDSMQGADASLELDDFRLEVARYRATLAEDPSFRDDERAIRAAAARVSYKQAMVELSGSRPKAAYNDLVAAHRYVPGYRDVDTQIPRVFERAQTTVAILPFDDQAGCPGLPRDLADHASHEISDRIRSDRLQFTRLVGQDRVYSKISLADLGDLSRDDAIRIGRSLGARLVVRGRYRGLRTDSNTDRYQGTIYHKTTQRDSSGNSIVRYDEIDFTAVRRERTLSIHWDYEIIDTDDESVLANDGDQTQLTVATVYTSYVPGGDCQDYFLIPPRIESADPDRAKRVKEDWHSTFGAFSVPALLERSRRDHSHRQYRGEYRGEFIGAPDDRPIFLDDLPSASEMARIVLDGTWHPVYDALRELDARDFASSGPAAGETVRTR